MKLAKNVFIVSLAFLSGSTMATQWEKIRKPISGQPQSIGGYSNGCIIGAQPLALKGEGYQVIRSIKNRYYGHPQLLDYLTKLGQRTQASGLPPIIIGDMGMPAGGRFSSGHASHQTGLDVDIWLRFGPMDDETARDPAGLATLMVDRDRKIVDERVWTPGQFNLIKLAAQDSRVNRIFVNPAIKVKLCNSEKADRDWLQKIRPWYGHDSHIHVRLSCPQDAKNCENQAALPAGDGCGAELYSWFEPAPKSSTAKSKVLPATPYQCQMILSSQGLE